MLVYILKFFSKLLFIESPPLFSVAALIEKGGKLLFLNLSYQKGLGLPGGIVQEGETLEETLKREVLEETGLKVTKSMYFSSVIGSYKGIPTASVVFLADTLGKLKSSEEGELVWMRPKDAIGKLFYKDSATAVVEKYIAFRQG